jgi:YVTN family beta-propeller protein
MVVDYGQRRLFASHKGTQTTAVLDLDKDAVLPSLKTGTTQGIAVDTRTNKVFFGNDKEQNIVVLDRKTYEKVGEIKVTGPVDDVAYDRKSGMIYADHDDGTEVWVIDPNTLKVVASVTIGEAPEYVAYDPTSDRLYQNIKSANTVQVINPDTNKVEATWDTAPVESPHGLALDRQTQRLFTAGKNGKLAMIDMKTGKVITTVDIARGVDQVAFDRKNKRIYCACTGVISVAEETDNGLKALGDVPSPKGSHTLAIDPKDHSVWTCYYDTDKSYFKQYKVQP